MAILTASLLAALTSAAAPTAAGDDYGRLMMKLKAMLDAHPVHPFALTHVGQLSAAEAHRLIAAHGNIHFITSHANPVVVNRSSQPRTDMFDNGDELAPNWRALVIRHADRFVLGFDSVWADHWGRQYSDQVALWRNALNNPPHPVAHAVAHENAERLWRLAPAKIVRARQ